MKFESLNTLVKASDSIKNSDTIFYDNTNQKFYTTGKLVSKIHDVIRYLCKKIIKLDQKLPNFCRSTTIIGYIKTYLNQHTPANQVLSTEYNIPYLTGKTLKEFVSNNNLKEDKTSSEIDVLPISFDKHNVESVRDHLFKLLRNQAPTQHIKHDLNLIDQDDRTKFLNSKRNGCYLLTNVLSGINRMITKEGEMTKWQEEVIILIIQNGANINNVDNSGLSAISRELNDKHHPDLISFLIGYVDSDSFQLQENENDSVLSKAINRAKQDKRYIPILKQIIDKGVNLDLPINDEDEKADKQLIDGLIKQDSKD